MKAQCSVTPPQEEAPAPSQLTSASRASPWADGTGGLLACGLGVLGFSGTASATRAVVLAAGPWVAALGRVVVAAAAVLLVAAVGTARRRVRTTDHGAGPAAPPWRSEDKLRLTLVAAAIVTAFPVLHASATVEAQAQEMTLLGGVLPLLTAIIGRLRTRQPAPASVWLGAVVGTGALCTFALSRGDPRLGKSFLLGAIAIAAAAYGYAEGAVLARRFGAYAVISRAVLVGLGIDALVVLVVRPAVPHSAAVTQPSAVIGLLYLGLVSMLLAYVAWYRGLARVGVPRGAIVQLAQVPLGLGWSWWLLGEPLGGDKLLTAAAVLLSLRLALRAPRPGALAITTTAPARFSPAGSRSSSPSRSPSAPTSPATSPSPSPTTSFPEPQP